MATTGNAYALGQGTGPLKGIKVVEIAGIGPGPHAATILADLGADVIRVEKPGGAASAGPREADLLTRGRPSVAMDLKNPEALPALLELIDQADVLIEGMRPGVTERLGIGPDECLARNPRLVYGRMTGWGQDGPLARAAGHDMNYISVAGVLHGLGQDEGRPHFPSNLVGDFGGGSTYLVIGVLAALLEARTSGRGQVVDAAIVDGAAHLNLMWSSMLAAGFGQERRASNLLDGGMPYYDLYETADGKHMSVGALEPQFYGELVERLGIADVAPDRNDFSRLGELRELLAATFKQRTQAEWTEVFGDSDACCAPVLPATEAAEHPHMKAREVYVERDGLLQPAPAPRFSRTQPTLTTGPSKPGDGTRAVLEAWGVGGVDALLESGAVVQS
ncbi:CaiB/BaiF CoA transferase family protein [Nocardioides caldifontis]|uniref:CaiB/BaiF CoA transferase family protein n=1 Tax=Nocardioides caldifontis TaxID=2588938 RepID=UPI0011E03B44|nr:CaiB/BaiF CoA-transferase family protein [Nocardioides caldifontis]